VSLWPWGSLGAILTSQTGVTWAHTTGELKPRGRHMDRWQLVAVARRNDLDEPDGINVDATNLGDPGQPIECR